MSSTLVETININAKDFAEHFLTCSTCINQYSSDSHEHQPKLLPCSHTVCRQCLERIVSSQPRSDSIKCSSIFALFLHRSIDFLSLQVRSAANTFSFLEVVSRRFLRRFSLINFSICSSNNGAMSFPNVNRIATKNFYSARRATRSSVSSAINIRSLLNTPSFRFPWRSNE